MLFLEVPQLRNLFAEEPGLLKFSLPCMDYEGDVQGILKRKDASIWQAYSFLLVKDRLLVFDIDKRGNPCGQIKEVVDLNQFSGITDVTEKDFQKPYSIKGVDRPIEYTVLLSPVNENQSSLKLRTQIRDDVEMWKNAFSIIFCQKPTAVDKSTKLKKSVAHTQKKLKNFLHLAESYKMSASSSSSSSSDPTTPLSLLRMVHDVMMGVRDSIDNAEQLRATLPRGIASLSELDQCQTDLHDALSNLVLSVNRDVMLNVASDAQPSELVSPVNHLTQKMMSICLQHTSQDSRSHAHEVDEITSQGSLPLSDNHFQSLFQQSNVRCNSYSSQSSGSYNDSLPLGWSPFNQRHSILSTDSIPEEEDSDLPPPHPSLLSDYPPLSPLSPPFRKESRGSLPRVVPPPLPPRSRMPPLPPRSSSSQGNSGDFSNIALFESHVYASSQQFVDHNGGGESRNSSWSASLEREGEYQVPGGGASPMFERPIPPPIPSRQTSINRDTGIWVDGSVTSHRSSSSHFSDESDSESESDADSGMEDEEMDEPPPLPPKNKLTFSQLYQMRMSPSSPPPPLPPRPHDFELTDTPASGEFPEGPPPTLPSRSAHFNGAKNYTRMMDRYAPSFEIDEEYLKLSLAEHHYQHSMKESVYHTYHREETRPVTPPRPPRTVAETTAETPHATTEADAIDNRTGILYQIDPASELVYTSTPAQEKGDSMHSIIKGGSVDALIAEATIYRDAEFVQAIVSTHTTFTTTDEILKKCIQRYRHFAQRSNEIAQNCVKLFDDILGNTWMFLTKPAIAIANGFIELLVEDNLMDLAVLLQSTLFSQFQYCKEHKCEFAYSPATSISSENLNWTFLLKVKPRDVALQMTQIDFEKFSKIKLCEILTYVKAPSETTSPNMCAFVNHFNSVSFWASSLILRRDSKDDRQRVYRRILSVMEHLIKLNNFSSAFALFAALVKTAVKRVVSLSSKQEKKLDASQTLMDSSESYKSLRLALKSATPPLIAYLGLCVADLTFLIHGNPDTLEGGQINFTKRHLTNTFMNVIRTSQAVPYNITPRDDVISFLNNFQDHMDEEEMWTRSEHIKPRKRRN